MMTEPEQIAHRLVGIGRENALLVIRTYAGLVKSADVTMGEHGWIRVDVPLGQMMHNGQPVQWIGNRAFVLPAQVFEGRRAAAIARAVEEAARKKPGAVTPGEALSSVLCPACQAIMAKQPVCPNCSKGKAGFKILCQCTECAHEVYL
jgi:hypothetical protein